MSKETYDIKKKKKKEKKKKRIYNGCPVWTENSVSRNNCSKPLGKSRDAE